MPKKSINSFNAHMSKQFKTDRCLTVVIVELAACKSANLERLCSMFTDRLLTTIPGHVFKGIGYQKDDNEFIRLAISIKPNLYTFINERMRYSGANYPSLSTNINNIWNKLLFDSKSFPKKLDSNYRIITVDTINGVNIDSKEIENITQLISDKMLYTDAFLNEYIAITKIVGLNLLSNLELRDLTFAEGYNIYVNKDLDIDLDEICNDLNKEIKNKGMNFVYFFNRNVNCKVISAIIFNDKPYDFINLLIEIITTKEIYKVKATSLIESFTSSEHFEFGEINNLTDPRGYSSVKLKAEEIFISMLTKKEIEVFKNVQHNPIS